MKRVVVAGFVSVSMAAVCLAPLLWSAAHASQAPAARGAATVLLRYALRDAYGASGCTVLSDSSVTYERVPQTVVRSLPSVTAPSPDTASPDTPAQIEKGLDVLVRALPPGTLWAKLYLPAPPPGRVWKGDDVAAFAISQARLFGSAGVPAADGSIEILGKRVGRDAAPPFVAGLDLRPVYLLTNPRRRLNVASWSAASEEQWGAMSEDERKQYGADQAAQIMALSPDERAQILDRIRQHDNFFDTVKDPLEKLLGHDL